MTRALVSVRHGGTLTYIHDKSLPEQWIRSLRASDPGSTADCQSGSGQHHGDLRHGNYRHGNDRHDKSTMEINPQHSIKTEFLKSRRLSLSIPS